MENVYILILFSNDQKAQKNGPHGNIYWVRVIHSFNLETIIERRWIIKTIKMDRIR
jgi:hypothetical protein